MSIRIRSFLVAAITTAALVMPLTAQGRSTTTSAALDAAVAARPATDRALVSFALTSNEAVAVAGRMGMNADAVNARVAALDDASAQQLADRIRAGGSNLVISTTAIIIILLVLILVTR